MTNNINLKNVNLETNCNQDCVYCQRNRYYNPKISPSTEEVKRIIMATEKKSAIMFTGGGEPTMREDLFELISYARGQGFVDIMLETNAVKLSDPKYVRKLKAAGLAGCVVSLHSHLEQISDLITSAPGTHKKTIAGLKILQRENIPVNTCLFAITSLNYDTMTDYLDFISKSFPYITRIGLSFIRPIPNDERSKKCTPKLSDIELELYKAIEHGHKLGIKISISPSCGIPFCYLHGREQLSWAIDSIKDVKKEEFDKTIHPLEKTKVGCCSACYLNNLCVGIHKTYLEIYGDSEFYPLFIDPNQLMEKTPK